MSFAAQPGRRIVRISLLALLLVVCASTLLVVRQAEAAEAHAAKLTHPVELGRVTFAAAGDVIPHQAVRAAAEAHTKTPQSAPPAVAVSMQSGAAAAPAPEANDHAGWDYLFSAVADVFQKADFGFVNLETPVAPVKGKAGKPFLFNAPEALVDSLKSSGIKIVSFANNHVMDQGVAGFGETLDQLRGRGVLAAGAAPNAADSWKPVIAEKNGIRVGWLGITRWLNGNRNPDKDTEPHVAFMPYPTDSGGAPGRDEAGVLEAVKAARAQCDLLVVSIHWGIEYAPAPKPEDVDLAHKMLEAGASAIIGHHPHVLQPVETYRTQDQRNTVIVYSLGNFLSNQSRFYVDGLMPDKTGEPRDSLIVRFAVVKKDYGPGGIQFELADFGMLPVWTDNNNLARQSGRERDPLIRPVFMDREIPRLQQRVDEFDKQAQQLAATNEQLPADQKREYLELQKQLDTLQHRRQLLLDRTGDDYVIQPPIVK
jgi:poly-gamma-glutamate synthesis protein (capsule biosynthesis protein)